MVERNRLSTGVAGLDEILGGGLIAQRFYLVRGGPGQGKTTLGLHFLAAGGGARDAALLIAFQESEEQIRTNAAAVGLDLSHVHILDLSPTESFFAESEDYDVFSPADVEREPLAQQIVEAVESVKPSRIFVDSLTQLRFLAPDLHQYRKQVLSLMRFLGQRGATVIFTSESTRDTPDDELQYLSDGVIHLDGCSESGVVRITKYRGSGFQKGPHDMRIGAAGLQVFPRMLPLEQRTWFEERPLGAGVPEVDQMLHGGLESGTVTLLTGPTGIGKSTFATLFAKEASALGRKTAVFLFEEDKETFQRRSAAVGVPLDGLVDKGDLILEQIEPMRYLPDEFSGLVRWHVEENGARVVVLDSLSGYEMALGGGGGGGVRERVHALAKNLARRGVTVILVNEVEAMTGEFRVSERGISYLSDNVVFLRYVEVDGQLKKAVGVLKKRLSGFERSLRLFDITPYGFTVGETFEGMQGVLLGQPERAPAER